MDSILIRQLQALCEGDEPSESRLCNMIAALFFSETGISWAGIYRIDESSGDALLGPFQGKPACMIISAHRGMIGRAVDTGEIVEIADVRSEPNHIACDCASRSELVIPLFKNVRVAAVLDIDSDRTGFFEPWSRTDCIKLGELFETVLFQN